MDVSRTDKLIMSNFQEQSKVIGVQTLVTWIPLVPILWFVVQPILVTSVSEAMAEDIQQTVKQSVEPVNNAFQVLLILNINEIRKEIAALEFRQRAADDWTAEDADNLADLNIELEALRDALETLRESV